VLVLSIPNLFIASRHWAVSRLTRSKFKFPCHLSVVLLIFWCQDRRAANVLSLTGHFSLCIVQGSKVAYHMCNKILPISYLLCLQRRQKLLAGGLWPIHFLAHAGHGCLCFTHFWALFKALHITLVQFYIAIPTSQLPPLLEMPQCAVGQYVLSMLMLRPVNMFYLKNFSPTASLHLQKRDWPRCCFTKPTVCLACPLFVCFCCLCVFWCSELISWLICILCYVQLISYAIQHKCRSSLTLSDICHFSHWFQCLMAWTLSAAVLGLLINRWVLSVCLRAAVVVWPTVSHFAVWSKHCHVTFIIIQCWTCQQSTVRYCSHVTDICNIERSHGRDHASLHDILTDHH